MTLCLPMILAKCEPTFAIRMGSETKLMRESKEGTAIALMEDVKVKCKRLQADGSIKNEKVTIKKFTVVRVGIECVFKDINQVLTQEDIVFDAMTPDEKPASGRATLSISKTTIPALTGIKIGTVTWQPPAATTTEAPPEPGK